MLNRNKIFILPEYKSGGIILMGKPSTKLLYIKYENLDLKLNLIFILRNTYMIQKLL